MHELEKQYNFLYECISLEVWKKYSTFHAEVLHKDYYHKMDRIPEVLYLEAQTLSCIFDRIQCIIDLYKERNERENAKSPHEFSI